MAILPPNYDPGIFVNPFEGWDPIGYVQDKLNASWSVVTEAIQSAVDALVDGVKGFTDAVFGGLMGFFDSIVDGVGDFFGGIGDFVGGVFHGITDFFGGLGRGVGDFFGGIGDFLGGVWNGIADFFGGLGRGVGDFFGGVWNGMMDVAKGWYQWLGSVIGDMSRVWMEGFWSIFVQNWYWTIPATIVGIVTIWYLFFRNTRKYPTSYDKMVDSNIQTAGYIQRQHETASKYITGNVSHNQFLERQKIKESNWSRWKK